MKRWSLHIDHPWSECVREDGAPMRVYLRTPWGFWEFGEKSQVYDRKNRVYTDRWAYLTYRPRQEVRDAQREEVRPDSG